MGFTKGRNAIPMTREKEQKGAFHGRGCASKVFDK